MNRYNVTVRGATGTLQQEGNVTLEEAIHELALPLDETADFEEMTFRQHGKTITLTRCPDPEPQTVQVLVTFQVSGDLAEGMDDLRKRVKVARQFGIHTLSTDTENSRVSFIAAEIVPPTPSVAEIRAAAATDPENAFLAACEGPGEDVTPLEWLSALLSELRETIPVPDPDEYGTTNRVHPFNLTADPEAMWTAYRESEALLLALRAAVNRAKGKPLPGVAAQRDCGAEAIGLLIDLMEYWDNGTPIHDGSLIANEVRVLLKRAGKR